MQKSLDVFFLTKNKRFINEYSRLSCSNPPIKLYKNKRVTPSPQKNTWTKTLLHKIKSRFWSTNHKYRTWSTFWLADDKSAH